MNVRSYRDLKVWQLAMQLTERVYRMTDSFPAREIYGLTSQVRRAAVSVPSNIAEGHARDSTKEYLRFLSVAQGSLAELETQVELSKRLGFAKETDITDVLNNSAEIGRMLAGLRKSLSAKLAPGSSPLIPGP
jgi:four helix bundle protein